MSALFIQVQGLCLATVRAALWSNAKVSEQQTCCTQLQRAFCYNAEIIWSQAGLC